MTGIRKFLTDLPWIVVLLLVIFVDGLYGGLYRLCGKSVIAKIVGIILLLSFVGLFFGGVLGWICRAVCIVCTIADIITVAISKRITLLAD